MYCRFQSTSDGEQFSGDADLMDGYPCEPGELKASPPAAAGAAGEGSGIDGKTLLQKPRFFTQEHDSPRKVVSFPLAGLKAWFVLPFSGLVEEVAGVAFPLYMSWSCLGCLCSCLPPLFSAYIRWFRLLS